MTEAQIIDELSVINDALDQARANLDSCRIITAPMKRSCRIIHVIMWQRLYGDLPNDSKSTFDKPLTESDLEKYGCFRTVKDAATYCDSLRRNMSEELRDEAEAERIFKSVELQKKRLQAALDTVRKVPLSRARKAPRGPKGELL
jgi:hypothetical protein